MRGSPAGIPARLRGWGARANELAQSHQEFMLLLLLFVTLRLMLLVISRPQGYFYDASDYDFYLEFGKLADRGLYPMLHYWTEYPPVFPWIAVAAYRVVETVPNLNGSPIFWFRMVLGSTLLLFDVGNLFLIYWLGRAVFSPARAIQIGWCYALLFAPLNVWLGWFDTAPLFFLLLSVALTVSGKHRLAALAAGLGFMVKVFPILAMPLLLKVERRPLPRLKLVVSCALAVGAIAAPFMAMAPAYLIASFRSMMSRSPWETPWAIYEHYFGYGQVAPLLDRTDPATASFVAYPSHLPWPLISLVFGLIFVILWTRPFDPRRPLNAVAFTGLSVNLFLLYSRGYSPQFLLYVVPFALLALPAFRAVAYISILSAINLIEYPIYITLFRDQHWLLAELVLMRAAILLLLCWEYLAALELIPSLQAARRMAAVAAAVTFALWAVVSLPDAGQAWGQASLKQHPDAALVNYLRTNAGQDSVVVFTEQYLYRELYPYLYQSTHMVLLDPIGEQRVVSNSGVGSPAPDAGPDMVEQLARLSTQYRVIYGVRQMDDMNGNRLEQLLSFVGRLEAGSRVNDLSVSRWAVGP
jgi:hypothetical protein